MRAAAATDRPQAAPTVVRRPAATAVAGRREVVLAGSLVRAWASSRHLAHSDRLLQALAAPADLDRVVSLLDTAAVRQVVQDAAMPHIASGFVDGAHLGADALRGIGVPVRLELSSTHAGVDIVLRRPVRPGVSLDAVNPAAVRWARLRAAALVVAAEDVKEAVRVLVVASQRDGIPVRTLMRQVLDVIGLDRRRAGALAAFEQRLRAAQVSAVQVQARAERYAAALLRQRAATIARTETIAAVNRGQQALWTDAVRSRLLDAAQFGKQWITTPDDLLCDECEALDGEVVPFGESFPGGEDGPPLHPNCRCATGLAKLDEE